MSTGTQVQGGFEPCHVESRSEESSGVACCSGLRLNSAGSDAQGYEARGGVSRVVESLGSNGMELKVPFEGRGQRKVVISKCPACPVFRLLWNWRSQAKCNVIKTWGRRADSLITVEGIVCLMGSWPRIEYSGLLDWGYTDRRVWMVGL